VKVLLLLKNMLLDRCNHRHAGILAEPAAVVPGGDRA
jgi:hypothetical protein